MMKQGNLRMMELEADKSATDYESRHHRNRLRELEIAEALRNEPREVEPDPFDDQRSFSTIISRLHKAPAKQIQRAWTTW